MTTTARTLTAGRLAAVVALALTAVAVAMLVAILVGSTQIGWPDSQFALSQRFQQARLAALVGCALGAAGAAYQAVLRNDLADPYLLGVASGATLGAYLWRLPIVATLLSHLYADATTLGQPTLSFIGAFITAAVVLGVSGGARGRSDPATVVLVGVIVSTLCGALVMLVYTFARAMPGAGSIQSIMIGELQTSLSTSQIWTAAAIALAGVAFLIARSPHLNIANLSDDEARMLGLRVGRERLAILAAASLVTAAAVSVSGPIGFVGLIAPHAARRIVGVDQRVALPTAAAFGAALVIVADAVLRMMLGWRWINQQIPLGVATAILGAPFFLYLLLRHRRSAGGQA